MTGRGKEGRLPRHPRFGDALASGLAVAALAQLAGFISLPFISLLLWTASENAWRAMASPVALDALLLSIKTTSISMAIILTVGTPAAYVLARAEFSGKRIVDTLVDIPAVLPPSAAGIALLLTFGRFGLVGQHLNAFGVTLSFTTVAVVIAEVFVAGHFYVRQAAIGFSQVRRDVEEAALVDGAGRFSAFAKVTVPLAFPALIAGAMMAWAVEELSDDRVRVLAGGLPPSLAVQVPTWRREHAERVDAAFGPELRERAVPSISR